MPWLASCSVLTRCAPAPPPALAQASRELEAAQGPAAKPPRRAAAPPGPPLSARGAAQAEAGAAEARRERARGGSAPAHVAGRAQLAASLGAAAACAHGSFASAAAALGRPPPAADPPAALPAWASAPASPEGSAMPDSLLERLLELDNAERRSDATMLAHPPSSLLLGAEFAAAREAEVERTRLELQAYLAQLRTSHVRAPRWCPAESLRSARARGLAR